MTDHLTTTPRGPSRPPARLALCFAVTMLLIGSGLVSAGPPSPAQEEDGETRRIVTIADIHGAFDSLVAILQKVGLVDEELRWSGGETILVQTGDFTDRGPEVRACMDLLMRLQQEAAQQGGKVIVTLGNHEVMNLVSFLRDTTENDTKAFVDENSEMRRDEAWEDWAEMRRRRAEELDQPAPSLGREARQAWNEQHPLGYVERMEALGPDGHYGRWLRSLPTVVRLDDVLFMHAGLSLQYADREVDEMNEMISEELRRFDEAKARLIEAHMITANADLVEIIGAADDKAMQLITRLEETGERPSGEEIDLVATLDWILEYQQWETLRGDGILWFRGLAEWPESEEYAAQVAEILDNQQVRHIAIGHTVQADGEIKARFGSRVFLHDTGMLAETYGGRPAALEIHDGRFTAIYLDETKQLYPPVEDPRAPSRNLAVPTSQDGDGGTVPQRVDGGWLGSDGTPLPFADDDAVLAFLRTAEVVTMEELDIGKSGARRVDLEAAGVRARAIFHTVDFVRERAQIGDRFHAEFRDSWRGQLAAYLMARELGFDNVPPTVRRRIGDEEGSLQLWLENPGLQSNDERVRAGRHPEDLASWLSQEWEMQIFDALLFNDDRNGHNILVDADWKLWMIDHTRAFQTDPTIRDPDLLWRIDRCLMARLSNLDRNRIEALLAPVLERRQINAVMIRRDAIIDRFTELIATQGPENVLYESPRFSVSLIGGAPAGGLLAGQHEAGCCVAAGC